MNEVKFKSILELIKRLLKKLSHLERDQRDFNNLLPHLRCSICGQLMKVVDKEDMVQPQNKGEVKIQKIILSCTHPRR